MRYRKITIEGASCFFSLGMANAGAGVSGLAKVLDPTYGDCDGRLCKWPPGMT